MNYFRRNKVLDPVNAIHKLGKHQNLSVVTGCFDIFHYGHLQYLRKAKKRAGDDGILLVITHDDESIKEHKGQDRPIHNLESRIEILSELETVDFVMPWYGWADVQEFVLQLEPKFLVVTQGESRRKRMGGVFANNNIKIVEIPFENTFSTTDILNKLGV